MLYIIKAVIKRVTLYDDDPPLRVLLDPVN